MRLCVCVVLLVAACRPPGYGKGDDAPEIDAPVVAIDAAVADAPADVAAAACDRGFRLAGHGTAAAVSLTGDFLEWAEAGAGAIAMQLGPDSAWTLTRGFPAGTYLYKFIVDGTWISDPTNPDGVDDGFGGVNSRFVCAPI